MKVSVPSAAGVAAPAVPDCSADRITRSLLGYGVIAGPFYVGISLIEAAVRPGFDLTRHSWSLLANGPYGWIHSAVLVLTGLMVVAAAMGFGRALPARAVPVLLGLYGAGLVGAGFFPADPADGFPIGTAPGLGAITWQGLLHLVAAGIGFLAFSTAAVVFGIRCLRRAQPARGVFAVVTGVAFLAAFAGIASGGAGPTVLAFVAAVIVSWTWLTITSLQLYRSPS